MLEVKVSVGNIEDYPPLFEAAITTEAMKGMMATLRPPLSCNPGAWRVNQVLRPSVSRLKISEISSSNRRCPVSKEVSSPNILAPSRQDQELKLQDLVDLSHRVLDLEAGDPWVGTILILIGKVTERLFTIQHC